MQMKGNARAAENWDTRQALLRELVPGQSRSASPLPFLIRTFFFLLSSPSSSFKRAREGDRGWKFLKEKVIRSRSKDSLDWFSSPEKSMRREEEEEEEKESVFSFPYVEQEWFKSDSDCNVSSFIYLFFFLIQGRHSGITRSKEGGRRRREERKTWESGQDDRSIPDYIISPSNSLSLPF